MTPMGDEWVSYPGVPGGYFRSDMTALERRTSGCQVCGREERLYRSRSIPPEKGGTSFIGNYVLLCERCLMARRRGFVVHAKRWVAFHRRLGEKIAAGEFGQPLGSRVLALAVERGFARRPSWDAVVQPTDPDACTCHRQAAHLRGSPTCSR